VVALQIQDTGVRFAGIMSPHGGARAGAGRRRKFRASRNLVIRVEEKLHVLLSKLAEEKDVTVSELVRPLLEGLVGGRRSRQRRSKTTAKG
jgi:hypothetical protein